MSLLLLHCHDSYWDLCCISVTWLRLLRLNNLSKCREFPSDEGGGTVTGKL